jgi:exodeoxyribonuclease VII small subunit
MKKEKELKFESALNRLEQIVDKLESGEVDLDDSIKLFEEGMEMVKFCSHKLEEVKRKVEVLVKKENGKLVKEKFHESDDETEPETNPAEKQKSEDKNELF